MIIFRSFKVFHLELVVLLQEPEHAQVSKGDYTVPIILAYTYPKSLYRSRAGSHFFGTESEIWADFGLVGSTEKILGPIMSNF